MVPIFILVGINAAIYILILYLLVTSLIHLKQKGLQLFLLATGALIIVRNAIHSLENQLGVETLSIRYELEQFAIAILAEAALSYLGLGTQPPNPSWGRMLNEAQSQMFQAPMLAVYPGIAIALAVLGLNLMGDGLRDLLDPRLSRSR